MISMMTCVQFSGELHGCRDEKIMFIMDESNVLDSGFLERMNTLLANGEVRREREGKEEERERMCKE